MEDIRQKSNFILESITDALRQMWQAEIDRHENMVQEEVTVD